MEWISVKDRLPNLSDFENELLCCFKGWDDMYFMRILEYDANYEEWSDWQGEVYKNVTHWMPLPKPPKTD